MKYIVHCNAWGDGMQVNTTVVPELLLPFEDLKVQCKSIGVEFITEPEIQDGMEIICALFIDCPPVDDPLLKRWVHKGIPNLWLMICENLYLQPNKTYSGIAPFADKIFSYEAEPAWPEKTTRLRYPVDLECSLESRRLSFNQERKYLCGMINSFKQSPYPGDLYQRRAGLAYALNLNLGEKFALWGHGWPFPGSLGRLSGGPNSKHLAYASCEFAVCMENNNSIPGYVTEKLFNALAAGCIPIYEYCEDDPEIPQDVFINAKHFGHPDEIIDLIRGMGPNEKREYRAAGTRFLESPRAYHFDSKRYVETLFEEVKNLL